MAKGNLFLGTAARSVGDVVMYRREGSQVSRVRVRKVANPRTDAQSLQRSAFSPVAKFFSPLAIVLERAWEGVSKSKSYSEFLKENISKARKNGWLLPKGTGFFPLPYQLTKGTLPVMSYSMDNLFKIQLTGLTASDTTIGQVSAALISNGYQNGDIITIIAVCQSETSNYVPFTYQFIVDSSSAIALDTIIKGAVSPSFDENELDLDSDGNYSLVAGAVVVARFENEKWRRSTQKLSVSQAIMTEIGTDAYKAAAVASYGNTAGDINPLVYLDGKDLEG